MVTEPGECKVPGCGRPAGPDAFLCPTCVDQLRDAFRDLPDLRLALDATYLREQRFSVQGYTPAVLEVDAPLPLPYNPKAGQLRRELANQLTFWVCAVQVAQGPEHVTNTTRSMSGRLLTALPYFRTNACGPEVHRTFISLQARAKRCVDRPPDLAFLGICSVPIDGEDCPEDLWAEDGKDIAVCRRCKTSHRVEERRAVLLAAVADQLAPAPDVARALSGLGMFVNADRIRKWKERGQILPHGTNTAKQPLYRMGDVVDRVLVEAERRTSDRRRSS